MLEYFAVFTKGGIVLWSRQGTPPLHDNPVDSLVSNVLLEERRGENSHIEGPYALKWTFANDCGLIFVAVYHKLLSLVFVEELLERIKSKFCVLYKQTGPKRGAYEAFGEVYDRTYLKVEAKALEAQSKSRAGPRSFEQTEAGKRVLSGRTQGKEKKHPSAKAKGDDQEDAEGEGEGEGESERRKGRNAPSASPEAPSAPDEAAEVDGDEPPPDPTIVAPRRQSPPSPTKGKAAGHEKAQKKGKGKQGRKWIDDLTEEEIAQLDKGDHAEGAEDEDVAPIDPDKLSFGDLDSGLPGDDGGEDEDDDEDSARANARAGGVWGFLSKITGNKVLTREDLEPVVSRFREHLHAKNVAYDIAEKLCESVIAGLEGQRAGALSTVRRTVRDALENALTRILTPKRNIDVLRDIAAHRAASSAPFSIVFMGVNGVGKSTNLAKVASWLRWNGLKVMLAACDTFRSGAVEQLRVHSRRLSIPLFERGYGKDDTGIAQEAIKYAQTQKYDVVLIDTAGRMQDKEPLMRAISKLVNTVQPNLVFFVGEALVGNDAVDQLTKFNRALADQCLAHTPRLIDGIILTKFDTIDDKVGAAISMVYTTGMPIVFLGTGQQYTDLKKLNVHSVVRTLLK
eukprot:m51a1_g12337 putative signal recognition particle receptor (624) ;mRNA; r:498998-502058